jgi:hypothetical protein
MERLDRVREELSKIESTGQDCDGFTSNTEEATFIETLIGELPEIW